MSVRAGLDQYVAESDVGEERAALRRASLVKDLGEGLGEGLGERLG